MWGKKKNCNKIFNNINIQYKFTINVFTFLINNKIKCANIIPEFKFPPMTEQTGHNILNMYVSWPYTYI